MACDRVASPARLHVRLGELYQAKGDHSQAEQLFTSAIAIHERVLGENHPRLIDVLDCNANLLDQTGRGGEAKAVRNRVNAIRARLATCKAETVLQ